MGRRHNREVHSRKAKEYSTHQYPESWEAGPPVWKFRLYVAGDAPQSKLALANLETLCQEHLAGQCQISIIDLLAQPQRYLKDDILVTPTLVRYEPEPVCTLMGNLSDRQAVLLALGLKEEQDDNSLESGL
jgi:circadian clock protein KaiB